MHSDLSFLLLVSVLFATFSALLTRGYIELSPRFNLLDIPNERSLHQTPVSRGGGIIFSLLSGIGFLFFYSDLLKFQFLIGVICAWGIAAVGFLDDKIRLPAKARLIVHFILSFLAISTFESSFWSEFFFGFPSWILLLAGVFYLVWMTNLYNFMDGVDGISSVQCIFVSSVMAILCWMHHFSALSLVFSILTACVLGFLIFNWSPAKVFMGDAGSGYLGFLLGFLSLISCERGAVSLPVFFLLMSVYFADSGLTLVKRILEGKSPVQAHREHLYQKLVMGGWSHRQVSLFLLILNFFCAGIVFWIDHQALDLLSTWGLSLVAILFWIGLGLAVPAFWSKSQSRYLKGSP